MLEWASGRPQGAVMFDGTLQSLVELYQKTHDSPYHDLKPGTQQAYAKHMRLLMTAVGKRRIDAVNGADVRRWYKNMAKPKIEGGKPRTGYAYLMVSILKVVVSYGASLGIQSCVNLRQQMSATKFKQGPARDTRLTHAQLVAFRAAAHEISRPSMALGLTLQFELAFRQRDVIGERVIDRDGRETWRDGLTWNHIGSDGILRKATTKTGADAAHRISDYPELVTELERTPPGRRIGPLVINEAAGAPYKPEQYRHWFRIIARKAGIPDEIYSMDARAGAVTEAYESGSTTEGAMALGTHTQASTSRRYMRESVEQTSRVAKLRIASREKK
jgi:hypothetical protein